MTDTVDNTNIILTYQQRRKEFYFTIKTFLEEIKMTNGSANKVVICNTIFEYICNNKDIFNCYCFDKFRNTVWKKMLRFLYDDPRYPDASLSRYLKELFPNKKIPDPEEWKIRNKG